MSEAGVIEPPNVNSRLMAAPRGRRSLEPLVQSMPPPKRPRINAPAADSSWATAPRDGPLLLSQAQVNNLGTYIDRDTRLLEELGWHKFIQARRGRSDLSPRVDSLHHPARSHLRHLRKWGARVPMSTAPWSETRLAATMTRGPHKSAFEYAEFLGEELVQFVLKGQWIVLPYSVVHALPRHLRRQLRVSPMGVVPQRDRRPRVIVDYSFFQVNDETVKLAPREAMQFGKALERILRKIVEADPRYGPVYLLKIDIADGFYRIWLNEHDIPTLAVSLPPLHGDTLLVALPLVLPMGWTESPPYFTTATETVADIANHRLQNHWQPPPHRLEALAETPPSKPLSKSGQSNSPASLSLPASIPLRRHHPRPVANLDVFVDDFIGMCQGPKPRRSTVRRVILHSLDEVFRPLEPGDNPHRKEPASDKKLAQGDGYWETRKLVLGWILDTIAMTIELPAHRRDRLRALLDEIPHHQRRLSLRRWQQILGELRSMAIAIPGSRGLFSLLQEALRHRSDGRIRLSRGVHDCLDDFRFLDQDLTNRPTRLYEIVAQGTPEILGATDACGYGMGGVAFPQPSAQLRQQFHCHDSEPCGGAQDPPLKQGTLPPIVWQTKLPAEITNRLVTYQNPHGSITNSDLELLATIVHKDVLAHAFDIRERTIATGTDNTPALAWQGKGSTSTTGPAAYLLRLQALHQRYHRYCSEHFYIPGSINAMADDASRLTHLSSAALSSHFQRTYPQKQPWLLLTPKPEMISSGISALLSSRADTASYLRAPMPTIEPGKSGPNFALTSQSTQPCKTMFPTPSTSSKFSPTATAREYLPPAVDPSGLEQWRVPSVRWGRRWPAWGPLIPG